jgi:signal transduction histidine kinase/DNA-binding response OmpR family regulator
MTNEVNPAAAGPVLLLPPTSRDAQAMSAMLGANGIACDVFSSLAALCEAVTEETGAMVLSEESLLSQSDDLTACLRRQPVWSDLPVVVLARSGAESPLFDRAVRMLGNVSVLERPVRVTTLLSVVRAALRGRARQYEVRNHLAELARAARALNTSEQRYRALATATSDVAYSMSADWSLMLPTDGRGTLQSDKEPVRDWMERNIPPDEHARVRAAVDRAIAEKSLFDLEHRVIRADGSIGWTHSRALPILDERGNVMEWFGAAEDVTARKQVEAALRESQERLAFAVEAGELGTFYCPMPMGRIIWNEKCKEHFFLPPDAEVDFDRFYAILHPDDRERTRRAVEQAVFNASAYDVEYRTVAEDGRTRWVRAKGRAYYDEQGNPMRFDGVTLDVTEQKRSDAERQAILNREMAARADAERSGRIKDEFLATLSHELRTPLNAIVGWSQIIRLAPDRVKDVTEGIEVIERNARAQTQIIEDLLDMSRIINGKLRLDVQRVDLASVIREAAGTVTPAANAKGIRLLLTLDPLAGPVSGDPNRLQQVFWNLLTNSIKFSPRGERVHVLLERVDSHLEVSVIDTGEGIDPEFLPHVFDRFRQADATTTRKHGGLGLGLAIVKQLVEMHGGTIRAKSPGKGQGSTFVVALPLTVVHPEPTPHPERRHPNARTMQASLDRRARIAGARVLVVDDEPDARNLLRRLLEECDAKVITASTADAALALLKMERPDVLVSDIGMPGEDGYTLIRRIRTLPNAEGGRTPAVALTAYARSEDRIRAVTAGFQHHLTKPVEPAELLAIVASLLEHSHSTPA